MLESCLQNSLKISVGNILKQCRYSIYYNILKIDIVYDNSSSTYLGSGFLDIIRLYIKIDFRVILFK